jgi:long-chain acyl-CoA synthetase
MSIDNRSQSTAVPNKTTSTAENLAAMFYDRVEASADKEAFRRLVEGRWTSLTWRQAAEQVEAVAAGLLALGIEPEQRVGIASSTRYEWILADLAIICAGGATTTVYPSTNAGDTAYILHDSGSRFVFAEDEGQLQKLAERRDDLPDLEKVVLFDGAGDEDWVMTLEEVEALGKRHLQEHPGSVRERADAIPAEQLATLIYTSGTTGKPKGVKLPHSAWVRHRHRRPGGQDRGEHGLGQADVHGRRSAHLREGPRQGCHLPKGG